MRKILSLLMAAIISLGMFAEGTATTVYYTAPAATIGTYTVKLNVHMGCNDGDDWKQYDMVKTDKTYGEDPIYSASFTDYWNGLCTLQFQLYDGSTWKSQDEVFNGSWFNESAYNGKMYVHSLGEWVAADAQPGDALPAPEVILKGSFDSWGAGYKFTPSDDKKTATLTRNITADSYAFKLTVGGAWYGEGTKVTRENCTDIPFAANTGDAILTADADGDYTFVYTFETKKLSITFPPAPINLTIDTVFIDQFDSLSSKYTVISPVANKVTVNKSGDPANTLVMRCPANSTNNKNIVVGDYGRDIVALNELKADSLIWTVSMRSAYGQPTNALSGFSSGKRGIATVLLADDDDLTKGNGYALLFGGNSKIQYRLAKYTNGLVDNTKITDIIGGTVYTENAKDWYTFRVVYVPATSAWSLYEVKDAEAWVHPDSVKAWTFDGSAVDDTYAATPLKTFGFFQNYAGGQSFNAYFANFKCATYTTAEAENPLPVINYYMIGSFNEWKLETCEPMAGDSIVYQFAAGKTELKVLPQKTGWDNAMGYSKVNAECSSAGISGNDGDNIIFILKEAGEVKIKVVDGKLCITGAFDVPEPQPVVNYYMVGSFNEWKLETCEPMVGDSIVYQFAAGKTELKVLPQKTGWDNAMGYSKVNAECSSAGISGNDGDNIIFILKEAGEVKIKVVDGKLCITGAFVVPDPQPTVNYYLVGTMNEWSVENAIPFVGDSLVINAPAAKYECKIIPSNLAQDWSNALGFAAVNFECSSEGIFEGENGNIVVEIKEDAVIKIKIVDGKLCITGPFYVPAQPTMANGFYLIGQKGWDLAALSAELLFAVNPDNNTEYVLNVTLAENDELKVVKVENDAIKAWYPDGMDNQYKVDAAHAGAKSVYFRETYNEDWAAFGGYIYIEANTTTSVVDLVNGTEAVKFIRDGQLYIRANGNVYTVMGQIVR